MAGYQPQPRVKNALDNLKLRLSAPSTAKDKKASLQWMIVANNPRIVVYTNDPSDMTEANGNGKISANLDLPVFFMLMNKLNSLIDGPNDVKEKIENKNYTWFGGKRSDEPKVVNDVWIGKDKDGIMWISISAKDRPKIKFNITSSEYHNLCHADGSYVTAGEASQIYTKGYIKLLELMMTHLAVLNYVEPEKKEKKDGGKSYGNKSYGNKSSSVESSEPESDDFPF